MTQALQPPPNAYTFKAKTTQGFKQRQTSFVHKNLHVFIRKEDKQELQNLFMSMTYEHDGFFFTDRRTLDIMCRFIYIFYRGRESHVWPMLRALTHEDPATLLKFADINIHSVQEHSNVIFFGMEVLPGIACKQYIQFYLDLLESGMFEPTDEDIEPPEEPTIGELADMGDKKSIRQLTIACKEIGIDPNAYATWLEIEHLIYGGPENGDKIEEDPETSNPTTEHDDVSPQPTYD